MLSNQYTFLKHTPGEETQSLKFSPRCSYGRQKTQTQTQKQLRTSFKVPEKIIKPNHFLELSERSLQDKTTTKLKESRETTNTMTDSRARQYDTTKTGKPNIRMEEIGNLLSEFKTKFAQIQQKYALHAKNQDKPNFTKFQPMTPQNTTFQARFDSSVNKLFLESSKTPISKTPDITPNSYSSFGLASENPSWNVKNIKSDSQVAIRKQSGYENQEVCSPTIDTRSSKKSNLRATFDYSKCLPLNNIPTRFKKAEQAFKFSNCKDVQSQPQEEQEDQTHESIVLQKLSSTWKKLKRNQTVSINPEAQEFSKLNSQEALKRVNSEKGNFYQCDIRH